MSKRMKYVYDVCGDLKQSILDELDNGVELSFEEVDRITIASFKRIADKYGVTSSTVRDACTRRLNYKSYEFYNAIKELIRSHDEGLISRMCSCASDDDSGMEIERTIRGLF